MSRSTHGAASSWCSTTAATSGGQRFTSPTHPHTAASNDVNTAGTYLKVRPDFAVNVAGCRAVIEVAVLSASLSELVADVIAFEIKKNSQKSRLTSYF
jgi:hypothetical protein